jgi:transposase-like protein
MVPLTLSCLHCGSEALVGDGHAPNGKQTYRCHGCGRRRRETPTPHAYPQGRREEILHAYQERSSLRGLTRTFGISRTTVSSWIKKSRSASSLPYHLADPRSRRCHFHDAGTGPTLVICAQKSTLLLGLDCLVSQDTTGGCLCSG